MKTELWTSDNSWPSLSPDVATAHGYYCWSELPYGFRWATLVESPTSHLWIRERGSQIELPLLVGVPFPLNPGMRYDVRQAAHPSEQVRPAPKTTTVLTWRRRRMRIALSESPIRGGVQIAQWSQSGNVLSIGDFCARIATRGAPAFAFRCRTATGSDTVNCTAYQCDEDAVADFGALSSLGEEISPGIPVSVTQGAGCVVGMASDHSPHAASTALHEGMGDHALLYLASSYTGGVTLKVTAHARQVV